MGFYVEPTHYKIKFEDPKYAGLEITAESINIEMMVELMSLSAFADKDKARELAKDATQVSAAMQRMFETFGDALVSWNLEDKRGNPIPATKEGVFKQEPSFIMMVIMNWMGAISSVDTNLQNGSNSGETFLMQNLMMEPLSPNQ